jgi:drug/metabolite transporter (DMT)-like permease
LRTAETERAGAGPHLALVAVQIIFGSWPVVGKVALRALPSTGLVAIRVAGASVAFFTLLRLRGGLRVPRRDDLARLALYSLLGIVLNQFLYVKGIALSTAVNAALFSTSIPVFTLLVGALLGLDRLSARAAVGVLLAAAGVVYLIDPARADFSGDKTVGNLLLVASNLLYGAYIAVSQRVFRRYGALTASRRSARTTSTPGRSNASRRARSPSTSTSSRSSPWPSRHSSSARTSAGAFATGSPRRSSSPASRSSRCARAAA